ncbi:MAG: M67 family metallopeptidase [Elusimicrobia bacterium]|nr:M67 family metallopeptidase [Elusimicrobiota bacterium]
MMLVLSPALEAAVRAHAARAYPEECCGLLAGPLPDSFGTPEAAVVPVEAAALDNAWGEGPRGNRYAFDPRALLAAERDLDRRGLAVLGVYHSHPDAPAWPSPFDLERAWPSYAYLIVSVRGRAPGEARVWTLSPDRRSFLEGDLRVAQTVIGETP